MMNHMTKKVSECLICGEELKYSKNAQEMECIVCNRSFMSNGACVKGHFVCDDCHGKEAVGAVKYLCANTQSKNPFEIAEELMDKPCVHMHGPEHHIIIGAALLTAYGNAGGDVDIVPALEEMVKRGSKVPGGACGFWGCCGAAISAGMFYSIILGGTPLTGRIRDEANILTSKCLNEIASHEGVRCCKRETYKSLGVAVEYVKEKLGIAMEIPERILCLRSSKNKDCIGEECPFYRIQP
ncbi:MAG: DUF5714 domain-containing protein [Anaerovoracaceae bacterium]